MRRHRLRLSARTFGLAAALWLAAGVGPASAQTSGLFDRATGARLGDGTLAPTARDRGIGGRVIGGRPIQADQVFAISYRRTDGSDGLCTGTLVGPRHVLTAAHCGCGEPESYRLTNRDDLRRRWVDPANGPLGIRGAPVLLDPGWCAGEGRGTYGKDLALLHLSRDAVSMAFWSSDEGATISRNTWVMMWGALTDVTQPGAELTVIGYGYAGGGLGNLGRKLGARVPVLMRDCAARIWWPHCQPFAEFVLASEVGAARPTDTCGGDSGGPVLMRVEVDDREAASPETGPPPYSIQVLVGVTSRRAPLTQVNSDLQCGGGGIYTAVGRTSVLTWLRGEGVPVKVAFRRAPGAREALNVAP